jgi:hypothetical protein
MIDAFYDRVEEDELLSPLFPGGVLEEHRRNVATWWCDSCSPTFRSVIALPKPWSTQWSPECGQIRSGTAVPRGTESQGSAPEQRSYSNRIGANARVRRRLLRPDEPPADVINSGRFGAATQATYRGLTRTAGTLDS